VHELGFGSEIAVYCCGLLVGAALGEGADYALDVFDWGSVQCVALARGQRMDLPGSSMVTI
jgi:hypothetical protein